MMHPQYTQVPTHPHPILLEQAAQGFLDELEQKGQAPERAHFRPLLHSLDEYLGPAAPLLAYTRLTGEAWCKTLPAPDQPDARRLLEEFRDYLRTSGWLDAARPVNQFD